jgi:hypothetical protein
MIEPAPRLPNLDGDDAVLQSIACTSINACVAVGYGPGFSVLVERWDGRRWTAQATPDSLDAGWFAAGISCASVNACMLVEGSRAERWNGTSWKTVPTRRRSQLGGVSCPSLTRCVVAGRIASNGPQTPPVMAQVWNGKGWDPQHLPTPANATDAFLNGVSCVSPRLCTAVGSVIAGTDNERQHTLVEQWNGTSWRVQTTPDGTDPILKGVSCTSSVCVAVGSGDSEGGMVVERYS